MISIQVAPNGETFKRIVEALRIRVKKAAEVHSTRVTQWRKNEELFVGYMPEQEHDRLRKAKRDSGKPDYTTIQVPYSYAIAMAAHSYWTSVFLARSPVFQFSGTTDEGENQVMAMESLIAYQTYKSRMLANLYMWLQDAPKYGEAWLTPYWRVDRARVVTLKEVEEQYLDSIPTGKKVKQKEIQEMVTYSGNAVQNVHPAKIFTDPRYPRNRFQDGEFCAVQTQVSYGQLLEGESVGQYINVDALRKKKAGQEQSQVSYGVTDSLMETSGAQSLDQPKTDSLTSKDNVTTTDVYDVYEVYVKIIPQDWGLGTGKLPEKWVFTITTDYQHLIECRPLGYMHDKFPLVQIEIEPEAYMHFSRSLLEIFGPVQETLDWLVNSHFFNVRAALNNQFVIDPSKVHEKDFQDGQPGKLLRLKPMAYGTDVRTAVQQLPVADMTRGHFNDMQMLYQLGERLGVSDSIMGVQTPSSRRTAQEIRGSQAFAIGRLKTISEFFSVTGFMDLGSQLVSNSQQFYDGNMKLKIVGQSAVNQAGQQFIDVSPENIMGEYGFEPVDGTLPLDRYAQANLWRELIMQMSKVPQVLMQYDLGKIFGYVAQLAGIRNLDRFKVQVVPDAQMLQMMMGGNSVPMAGGNPLEPGQISGMGPTA